MSLLNVDETNAYSPSRQKEEALGAFILFIFSKTLSISFGQTVNQRCIVRGVSRQSVRKQIPFYLLILFDNSEADVIKVVKDVSCFIMVF